MRRLILLAAATAALGVVPAAIASPAIRLTIVHVLRGCHAWGTADSQPLGPTRTLTLARGTKLTIRVSCPMGFDVVQTSGPRLVLGSPWQPGTTHALVFAKRGVYGFRGTNLVSSADAGLQTLGPDNVLVLTVRVR